MVHPLGNGWKYFYGVQRNVQETLSGKERRMNMEPDYFWRNFWTEFTHLSEGSHNRIKAIDMMREDVKKSVQAQITDLQDFTAQLVAIKNHLFREYPAYLGIRVKETEDWWDRITGGWSLDNTAVEQPGQAGTSSISYPAST